MAGAFYIFLRIMNLDPIQLYIHVPFCEKKCHYCDFASWELPAVQQRRWFEIIMRELDFKAPLAQNRKVDTVFFGGGTPSLLAVEFLEKIREKIFTLYDLSQLREMSIECNPSSLNQDKLNLYHQLGFTRLSLGVQSFHSEELTRLGRVHTVETAGKALKTVAEDGRFQFSGDLIFGVPGQTEDSFLESLKILLSYDPDHISFYGLTIEEGTEFAKQKASGALVLPEDGIYNGMYLKGVDLLAKAGYWRYEVSNFSKADRPCKHNLGYWNGVEYLAFGPGAHEYYAEKRKISPRSFEEYIAWGQGGFQDELCQIETLTPDNLFSEAVLLGLRQGSGLDLAKAKIKLPESVLQKWEKVGMILREENRVRLIGEGWLFLDEIGSDFLARGSLI